MPDQSLLKASLFRLTNDNQLSDIADDTAADDVVVEATVLEKIPLELRELHIGQEVGDISVAIQVFDTLKQIREAQRAINELAASLGWVGQPTSDFSYTRADGYLRHYEHASIYWTPASGAKEVHGAIRQRYFEMGAERSYLGFPQTNELVSRGTNGEEVRYSNFQGGTIFWTETRGAFLIPSFAPITERHALGAWLYMVGTGFTPNGRVSYWIVNAPNEPASMGSEYAAVDGRVGANANARYVTDLRNRSGDHPPSIARAVDEATGQASDRQLSYALY